MERIKIYIVLFFALYYSFPNFAQTGSIDEFNKRIGQAKSDSEKVQLLLALSNEFSSLDSLNPALENAILAVKLSENSKTGTIYIDAELTLATVYVSMGNNNEALKHYDKVETEVVASKDTRLLRKLFMGKGRAASYLGNYPLALKYNLKALDVMHQAEDKKGEAGALNNIGIIYDYMGDLEKALKYYFASVEIKKPLKEKRGIAITYTNISEILRKMNKMDSASFYANEAFKIASEINDPYVLSLTYSNKAALYLSTKELQKSLDCLLQALKIDSESGDEFGVALDKINIGGTYVRLKKYVEAEKYIKEGMEMSIQFKNLENQKVGLEAFSQLYEDKGDYKTSMFYFKKFKKLNDSIFNSENMRQFNDLKTQYEVDQKEAELKLVAKEEEIRYQAELEQQRVFTYFILGGAVLVFALLVLSYRSNRQRKKANQIITSQKLEVEKQKHIVDEKQKEILDSIRYAKRIQTALMANEKYIEKNLNKLNDNKNS